MYNIKWTKPHDTFFAGITLMPGEDNIVTGEQLASLRAVKMFQQCELLGHAVVTETDAEPELRQNGPTILEWVNQGYADMAYPPHGFASKPDGLAEYWAKKKADTEAADKAEADAKLEADTAAQKLADEQAKKKAEDLAAKAAAPENPAADSAAAPAPAPEAPVAVPAVDARRPRTSPPRPPRTPGKPPPPSPRDKAPAPER